MKYFSSIFPVVRKPGQILGLSHLPDFPDDASSVGDLANKVFAKYWNPNSFVGNLYKKEGGLLKYPTQVLAWETFAKVVVGFQWILDHAPAGTKINGEFYSHLNLNISNDGSAVAGNVRYNIRVENLRDILGNIANLGAIEGLTMHRVNGSNLDILIILNSKDYISYNPSFSYLMAEIETITHEIYYHATWYEKKFLANDYTVSGSKQIDVGTKYAENWIKHYEGGGHKSEANELRSKIKQGHHDLSLHVYPLSKSYYAMNKVALPLLESCMDLLKNNYESVVVRDSRLKENFNFKKAEYVDAKNEYDKERLRSEIEEGIDAHHH